MTEIVSRFQVPGTWDLASHLQDEGKRCTPYNVGSGWGAERMFQR